VADDGFEVPNYPIIFRHMVLAIFLNADLPRARPANSRNKIPVKSSPNKDNFDPTKFNAAMDIALAQLKKYRMVPESSSREAITLTSYGREADSKHRREQGGATKTKRFDKFYVQLLVEERKHVNKSIIAVT